MNLGEDPTGRRASLASCEGSGGKCQHFHTKTGGGTRGTNVISNFDALSIDEHWHGRALNVRKQMKGLGILTLVHSVFFAPRYTGQLARMTGD